MTRLQRFITNLSDSEFYRNIFSLFSGIFSARLIPALFAILLARIYIPDNFGDFVLFLSIASLLAVFVNGGYEAALVLADSSYQKSRLFRFALRNNLIINSFIVIGILIFITFFRVKSSYIHILMLLVPFYAFSFGALQLIRNILISNKLFKKLALLEIIRTITTGALQSLFFILPETGLFLGVVLSQFITLSWFIFQLPETSSFGRFRYSKCEIALARRYRNFPFFSLPSEFFNYLSNQLPVFMIKPIFGITPLGLYSFSHRYLNIPVQLTSISIGSVYIQKARSLKNSPGELSGITFGLFQKQVWLAIIPFTILALWGNLIFGFVFGNEWEYSGSLARILSPWLLAVFISSPLSTILIAKEKQKISMIFNIFLLLFRILALSIGGLILKDMTMSIVLFSLTGFIFFTLLGIYSLYLARVNLVKALLFLLKVILVCVVPLVLIYLWL
jgi:O-antigen/teichoic acid export membrane protein